MKSAFWIVAIVIAIFMAALALDIRDFFYDNSLSPISWAKESPLVVYAVTTTNSSQMNLVIKEIWKDTRKSHTSLLGKNISHENLPSGVKIPEGAVIFFNNKVFDNDRLVPGYFAMINDGKVVIENNGQTQEVTVSHFKKVCGF